jgi:hypothetical protein
MLNLRSLSPDQSRRLALGIFAAAVLAIVAAIAVPVWLVHRHYDAAITDMTDKLDRYRRIATTRPEVVRSLEAVRAKASSSCAAAAPRCRRPRCRKRFAPSWRPMEAA